MGSKWGCVQEGNERPRVSVPWPLTSWPSRLLAGVPGLTAQATPGTAPSELAGEPPYPRLPSSPQENRMDSEPSLLWEVGPA